MPISQKLLDAVAAAGVEAADKWIAHKRAQDTPETRRRRIELADAIAYEAAIKADAISYEPAIKVRHSKPTWR